MSQAENENSGMSQKHTGMAFHLSKMYYFLYQFQNYDPKRMFKKFYNKVVINFTINITLLLNIILG